MARKPEVRLDDDSGLRMTRQMVANQLAMEIVVRERRRQAVERFSVDPDRLDAETSRLAGQLEERICGAVDPERIRSKPRRN